MEKVTNAMGASTNCWDFHLFTKYVIIAYFSKLHDQIHQTACGKLCLTGCGCCG